MEITSSTMLLNLLILKLFDFAWGRECKSAGKNESFEGISNKAGYLKILYLNSLNYEGETPLHLIAEIYSNGKVSKILLFYEKSMLAESLLIVKELISADADINARTLAGNE